MSSADPDSYQGPKDISFSTVLRSTNWAIGGCLRFSRLDFFSGDCLIFFHLKTLITTWRKQPERFIKFFHDSDSKQGPKDISFSTILRSTNWAIGRLDFFSADCVIFFHLKTLITTWRKQPEIYIKFFHDSMRKICFFFALYNHIVKIMANIWLHVQNYLLHFPLNFNFEI